MRDVKLMAIIAVFGWSSLIWLKLERPGNHFAASYFLLFSALTSFGTVLLLIDVLKEKYPPPDEVELMKRLFAWLGRKFHRLT
jgi:hypothetical protein